MGRARAARSALPLTVALALVLIGCSADERAEPASWGLAPGEVIGPETTAFDVLVSEHRCSSGRSVEGRIAPPTIVYGEDTVHVTIEVFPLAGAQTCPGPPPTPYTITLREPLGTRALTGGVEVDPQYIEPP